MQRLGSLAGAGTLGILIPPSITMVVYAVAANVSIIQIFLAGFLPGLLVMALYSGYIAAWHLANPSKQPPPEPRMSRSPSNLDNAATLPSEQPGYLISQTVFVFKDNKTTCRARLASRPRRPPGLPDRLPRS